MNEHLSVAAPSWLVWVACIVGTLATLLLFFEVWKQRASKASLGSGIGAILALELVVLRPERVQTHEVRSLPAVTVLIDASRSMALPGYDGTRFAEATRALFALEKHAKGKADLNVFAFGKQEPTPWSTSLTPSNATSQLDPALNALERREDRKSTRLNSSHRL